MDDLREKVIKGLECCLQTDSTVDCEIKECPYHEWKEACTEMMLKNALSLLKAQEAIEPVEMIDDFYPIGDPLRTIGWKCGICGERIAGHDNFCPNCGKAVKWE